MDLLTKHNKFLKKTMISNYVFINQTHEKKLQGGQRTTHSNIHYMTIISQKREQKRIHFDMRKTERIVVKHVRKFYNHTHE